MDTLVSKLTNSDIDLLIEEFRVELADKVDDNDTRKLTITSTVSSSNCEISKHDIDEQIGNLEILIKKLHDEITEMSKKANINVEDITNITDITNEVHEDIDNETNYEDIDNSDNKSKDSENLRNNLKKEKSPIILSETEQLRQVFPMVFHDVINLGDEETKSKNSKDVTNEGNKTEDSKDNATNKTDDSDIQNKQPDNVTDDPKK